MMVASTNWMTGQVIWAMNFFQSEFCRVKNSSSTQCFGKRTRLFGNRTDGQVEWREVLLLVFEGIKEAIPLVHAVGHPLGNRLDRRRPRLRLVLHHLRQRQPRFQHVTQRPAMFNQRRQGSTR